MAAAWLSKSCQARATWRSCSLSSCEVMVKRRLMLDGTSALSSSSCPHNQTPPHPTSVRRREVAPRPSGDVGATRRGPPPWSGPRLAADVVGRGPGTVPTRGGRLLCSSLVPQRTCAWNRLWLLGRRMVSRSRRRSCSSRLRPVGAPPTRASKPRGRRPRPTIAWPHRRHPGRARDRPPGPAVATEVGSFSFSCSAPRMRRADNDDDDDDVEALSGAPTNLAMCSALPGSISGWQTAAAVVLLACWWWWWRWRHGEVGCWADDDEDPCADSRRAVLKVALPGAALFTFAGIASAAGPKSPHHP